MKLEVYKGRITIDVMGASENAADFMETLGRMSLSEILQDADDGMLISGTPVIESVAHVHRDDVAEELQAVGNDGSFFDCELEDEDEA